MEDRDELKCGIWTLPIGVVSVLTGLYVMPWGSYIVLPDLRVLAAVSSGLYFLGTTFISCYYYKVGFKRHLLILCVSPVSWIIFGYAARILFAVISYHVR